MARKSHGPSMARLDSGRPIHRKASLSCSAGGISVSRTGSRIPMCAKKSYFIFSARVLCLKDSEKNCIKKKVTPAILFIGVGGLPCNRTCTMKVPSSACAALSTPKSIKVVSSPISKPQIVSVARNRDKTIRALTASVRLSLPVDLARQDLAQDHGLCSGSRTIGIGIMIQLANAYEMKDNILAYAMALLDMFLAERSQHRNGAIIKIEADRIQDGCIIEHIAVACFMLASKFVGSSLLWIDDILGVVRLSCSPAEIESAEGVVLSSIDWSLHLATGKLIMSATVLHNIDRAARPLTKHSAAFEIADSLLRCNDFHSQDVVPLREHINFLMLLAHSRADMLHHSSRAIAAAAILTSLRLQAGPVAAAAASAQLPPAVDADEAAACAAAMWAMREDTAPPPRASPAPPPPASPAPPAPPATWSNVVKPAPPAAAIKRGADPGLSSPVTGEMTTGAIALVSFRFKPSCPRRSPE
jgi:hypothetical protein